MKGLLIFLAACDGVFGIQHIQPGVDAPADGPPDAPSSYKSTVLGDHPIAYFPLDEGAGAQSVVDLSAGAVGQVQGLATGGAAAPFAGANTAFAFDGINSSIELGDVFAFTGNARFSVEAWVWNGHATAFDYALVAKWRQPGAMPPSGWIFYYQEGDDLIPTFRIQRQDAAGVGFSANAAATTSGPMWHHVVGTYDGSELEIYLDGTYASSHASTEALEHLTLPLEIGAQNGNSHDKPLLGSLDEVALYDYALSAAQIRTHYEARSL